MKYKLDIQSLFSSFGFMIHRFSLVVQKALRHIWNGNTSLYLALCDGSV